MLHNWPYTILKEQRGLLHIKFYFQIFIIGDMGANGFATQGDIDYEILL